MAVHHKPAFNPLLDYIVFVGPTSLAKESDSTSVNSPVSILGRFPVADRASCLPLTSDIAYFCQPNSKASKKLDKKPQDHLFMLTDKETDIKRYGTCITFFSEGHSKSLLGKSTSLEASDPQMISIAIITRFLHFNFFRKCLHQLYSFVEELGAGSMTWWDLIGQGGTQEGQSPSPLVDDIINWLHNLLDLSPPDEGEMMEIELSIAPPLKLFCPPPRRFPTTELSVHQLFDLLSIDSVLLIFKLLMCEEKVLIHSSKYWMVSEAVMSFVVLMYPFSYLYPIIPLLPEALPDTENLLLVPTPYFIGVESSFLNKLEDYHKVDVWLVDMDQDKVTAPENHESVPDYPNCEIELHSDIQLALTKADGLKVCGENIDNINDILDTEIQTAFVKFLLRPDMLGLLTKHMYIIRLFPRPTVSLKSHEFSDEYHSIIKKDLSSPDFVGRIISSQCVRNFLEWTLNPDNTAFLEITPKDVSAPQHLGSRLSLIENQEHFDHKSITIYPQDPSSALYNAMLKVSSGSPTSLEGHTVEGTDTSDDDSWVYIPLPAVSQKSSDDPDGSPVVMEMTTFPNSPQQDSSIPNSTKSTPLTNKLLESVTPGGFSHGSLGDTMQSQSSWTPPSLPDKSIMCGSFTLQPGYLISPIAWSSENSPSNSPVLSRHTQPVANVKETQCLEFVQRILEGQKLPWIKGQLESLLSKEEARITMLEALQVQLEVKVVQDKSHGSRLCELSQIGVHKGVFNGICELFKYIWKGAIQQFSVSPDCKMKSMFLLFRLACCIYLDEHIKKRKMTRNPSVRVSKTSSTIFKQFESPTSSIPKVLVQSPSATEGHLMFSSDSVTTPGEETTPNETTPNETTPNETTPNDHVSSFHIPRGRSLEDLKMGRETIRLYARIKRQHEAVEEKLFERLDESRDLTSETDEKITKSLPNPPSAVTPPTDNHTDQQQVFSTPSKEISSPPKEDIFYTPQANIPFDGESVDGGIISRAKRTEASKVITSPRPSKLLKRTVSQESLDGFHIFNLKGIGDPLIQDHTVMAKLSQVLIIPRKWTQHYWNNMVWSLITFERDRLCWNEATSELAKKFLSLDKVSQKQLVGEEDQIISSVIVNVSLYMAATGMSPENVRENLYRYVAKTRVNDSEGSMLNSVMREFMKAEKDCSNVLKKFSLLPLYSEASPIASFVVHKGTNRTGQVLKLVITNTSCAVCHFPESYVLVRLWYDGIEHLQCSVEHETITLLHKEVNGTKKQYQFCTKQVVELHALLNRSVGLTYT